MALQLLAGCEQFRLHQDEAFRGVHVQLLSHVVTSECAQLPAGEV